MRYGFCCFLQNCISRSMWSKGLVEYGGLVSSTSYLVSESGGEGAQDRRRVCEPRDGPRETESGQRPGNGETGSGQRLGHPRRAGDRPPTQGGATFVQHAHPTRGMREGNAAASENRDVTGPRSRRAESPGSYVRSTGNGTKSGPLKGTNEHVVLIEEGEQEGLTLPSPGPLYRAFQCTRLIPRSRTE